MKILFFDTSTERGIVSLYDDKELLFEELLPFGYDNSTHLIPAIDRALQKTGLKIADFNLIVCGVGPGSYTGIRVGAVIAKTFSYTHKIPLIGISTLKTFIPNENKDFVVLIDAKIGGAYFIKGKKTLMGVEYITEPEVSELDKLNLLENELILTPNKARLQSLLSPQFLWEEKYPNSSHVINMALEDFKAGNYLQNGELELLYLRKTQAEIEKEKKLGR